MRSRFEVYRNGATEPSMSGILPNASTVFVFAAYFSEVDAYTLEELEVVRMWPLAVSSGLSVDIFTLSRQDMPLLTFLKSEQYQHSCLREIVVNPSETKARHAFHIDVPAGEAVQYTSRNNEGSIVFWHETGEKIDLSGFSY